MKKDLFGKPVKQKKSRAEIQLAKYDRESFNERLARLKFIEKTAPSNYSMLSSFEFVALFHEAQSAFINGEYIATIMLSQAFIEHRLQNYVEAKGASQKETRTFAAILKYLKDNELLNELIITKIESLRLKRNPFTHLKPIDHPYTVGQRIGQELRPPADFLEDDAKEALGLMFTIFNLNLY